MTPTFGCKIYDVIGSLRLSGSILERKGCIYNLCFTITEGQRREEDYYQRCYNAAAQETQRRSLLRWLKMRAWKVAAAGCGRFEREGGSVGISKGLFSNVSCRTECFCFFCWEIEGERDFRCRRDSEGVGNGAKQI